jgi:hypothetical protein
MTEILITDVTRMRRPNICVAGYTGGQTFRLDSPSPTEDTLAGSGALRPGDVVDIFWRPLPNVKPPHVEDGEWRRSSLRHVKRYGIDSLTRFLERHSLQSVREAFGEPKLTGKGGNPAFPTGQGERSLASVAARNVRVRIQYNRPRVEFADANDSWRNVPLEDLMIHQHADDCLQCRSHLEQALAGEFDCDSAVLRVGLGRPFVSDDHPAACWMQVNGIYPLPPQRKHFV